MYASIEVLNENNNSIYKKEYIGNKSPDKAEETVDIKPGYKIKIYHREPNGRLKIFDLDGTENTDYKSSQKTNLFVIIDKGLEGLNVDPNKRIEKSIEVYAENLKNEVNINKSGKYEVIYEVTDKDGNKATKTIFVTVKEKEVITNSMPTIEANDREINEGDNFNLLEILMATDKEDGDLTKNVKVIKNEVDSNKPGRYKVTYEVADKGGNKATKTINVNVKPKEEILNNAPIIEASDKEINEGNRFNPLGKVSATDKEDGDLTNNIKVIKNEADINKPGKYEVTDKEGKKATKTIFITVKPKEKGVNNKFVIESKYKNKNEKNKSKILEKDTTNPKSDVEIKQNIKTKSKNNNIIINKNDKINDTSEKANKLLNPITGDKGVLSYVSIGVALLAGLYVNMRKRKK